MSSASSFTLSCSEPARAGEQGRIELKLTKAESYTTGVVNLTYRR